MWADMSLGQNSWASQMNMDTRLHYRDVDEAILVLETDFLELMQVSAFNNSSQLQA